jgi:hypothetical protein
MFGARLLTALAVGVCLTAVTGHVCEAQNETDLAKTSQNPVANLTSFPLQFNYNTAGGLASKTALLLNVQPVMPLPINKEWLVIARTVIPYVNFPMPDGTRATGIADIQEQVYFTPRNSGMFTWGAGPILSIPTATNDVTRTGQWALGPTAVGLITYERWVIGVLGNQLWRIGGVNFGPDVNQLTLQPFINFNIPPGWSITTSPLITSDWSAPEGQRWTLPVGIGVGKVTAIGRQAVSLGMQYYHNAMHPDVAGADQWRFVFALLYPIERR